MQKRTYRCGPSIASGNHVCNPICADFPIAPINNNTATRLIQKQETPKKELIFILTKGIKLKIIIKSVVLKREKISKMQE